MTSLTFQPLETWLELEALRCELGDGARVQSRGVAERFLPDLERVLDGVKLPTFYAPRVQLASLCDVQGSEGVRLQLLYQRTLAAKVPQKQDVERILLTLLARVGAPGGVAFWRSLLEHRAARDSFSKERRRLVLSALGLDVLQRRDAAAFGALVEACDDSADDVRMEAADTLGVVARLRPELAEPALSAVSKVADSDRVFEPRFVARCVLSSARCPVPEDAVGTTYAIELLTTDYSCVVELRAEHSLDDLHLALQDALGWDNDHLYAFRLSTEAKGDARFSYPPYGAAGVEVWAADEEGAAGEQDDEAALPLCCLGQLGLRKGHALTYLFDFGDNHVFKLRVVGVGERGPRGAKLPRTRAKKGKRPEQYPQYD